MRKTIWIVGLAFVLAVAVTAIFILARRFLRPSGSGPSEPPSIANLEGQDVPPLPHLSLQINSAEALEVFQGTPLIFTVRVANQRAANAASTLQAHEA